MDFGGIIYNEPHNEPHKIECIQYNTYTAITGAIHGIFRERPYRELRLESQGDRCRFGKLTFFITLCKVFLLNILLSI